MTLVWVLPFQLAGQSPDTVRAIAQDWLAFRVIYAMAGVTTLTCTWIRISKDLRRIRRFDESHSDPTDGSRLIAELDVQGTAKRLRGLRYSVNVLDDSLKAVKNKYSLLGGSVFHLGVVLLGLSLVAQTLTTDSVTLRVTEGQTISDAAGVSGVAGVPFSVRYLKLQSIRPKYFKDVLLFTRLDARVTKPGGSARSFSLSRPYWLNPTTVMAISDYNLAPVIEVIAPDGTKQERVVAMNLVPPGTQDTAQLPDVPFEISIIAYPDHGVVGGRDVSLSYNIKKPAFMVTLQNPGRNGSILARRLIRLEEPISIEGYVVRIRQLSRSGNLRITSAPALPFVALALITMVVGLVWRCLFRRRTALVWASEGGVLVDGWIDIAGRSVGRALLIKDLQPVRDSR